jgi:GT2 family glycosyltransferase
VTVSVVIVAYDAGEALTRCLRSLEHEAPHEILVVNNGGGGPEIEEAERRPEVEVVASATNLGFAAGCNVGAARASGEVLLFVNPDTVVRPGAVWALADALADPSVGIAMPRLRLLDEPELLNSAGNVVHVTGIAWAGRFREPASSAAVPVEIPYASGAALAVRAPLFRELGGFTDELFMYQEDLELGWKARLRGLRVVLVPDADVLHEYDYARHPFKRYLLERNRLVFLLSAYSGRLLGVLAPLLISTELGMALLALREGWLRDKVRGWAWLARNAGWVARHRRATQRLRRVPDRELVRFLTPVLDPAMLTLPAAVRAVNPLVSAYWSLARRLL